MNLLWKKYTIAFSLDTKDNKCFRYVIVEFEQKRNWHWVISENTVLNQCIKDCIQEWFLIWINLNDMYEDKDPNRLIDEKKLELVNKHIRTTWIMDWQPDLAGKIRNIKITHLIR